MGEAADTAQPQAYDAEGKPIAPEAYGEAASAGQAFFKQGAKVYVQDPSGRIGTVDASEVGTPGYTVLTPQQLEAAQAKKQYGTGLGNVAKAGAAGAARGLTLGASDALLSGIGGEDTRKALQGLRQANPVTSTVSEIGGALAPLVLSGGGAAPLEGAEAAGALARAGEAGSAAVRTLGAGHRAIAGVGGIVERGMARGLEALGATGETALGRIGAAGAKMAARGAAEGALYGAAQEANDAVLNGDEITAEKIVAGMGHGALFGGALGGVLGAGGKAVGEGLERLVPKKEALQKLAREQALRAISNGGSAAEIKAAAGGKFNEAGMDRLDTAVDDMLNYSFKEGAAKGERAFIPGANAEELAQRLAAAKEEVGAAKGGMVEELSKHMEASGQNPDVGEFLRRVKEQVTDPLWATKSQGARSKARAIDRELSIFASELEAREKAIVEHAANGAPLPSDLAQAPTFAKLDAYKQQLSNDIYNESGLVPKAKVEFQKVRGILSDFLKENASQALAKAGEDANAYNELNRLYSSFAGMTKVAESTAGRALKNRMLSPSDHALAASSFIGALSTGNVGALGAMGYAAAAGAANKLLRERGNSLVATLARRASETDNVIDTAAKALAGTGEKVKAPALTTAFEGKNIAEEYQRTADRVRELAQPAFAQAHISSLIPEVAAQYPNVGMAVSQKLLGIYQALAAKIPANHTDTGMTLTPLAVKTRVSPVQQRQFMNAAMGALQPEKVIADLGRGVINRTAIEMLKEVHPKTFQQLRTQVADVVQNRKTPVPFQRRIMLSTVFDFVGDSSLEPTRFTALQQTAKALTIQEDLKNQQAAKPTSGSSGGNAAKLTQGMQLPAQAAAGDI